MKKILTCFVTILVLVCVFNVNVFAEEGAQTNTKKLAQETIIPIPESFITPDSISCNKDVAIGVDQYYPDKLNDPASKRYSPQKNTTDFGVSWASAVCRTAESYYNLHKDENDPFADLSEMHLAWFSYHTDGVEDQLGNIKTSGTSTTATGTDVFNIGGNPILATFSVANGIGFVDEARFPYKSSYSQAELNDYTKKENCYNPDYRLINSEWYALNNDLEIKNVKSYIYYNGQIATTIHLDEDMINYDHPNLYYYYDDTLSEGNKVNYGATIVGWDDNINAQNFASAKDGSFPEHNGAWIVRCNYKDQDDNSLPTTILISYDEASIRNSFAASFEIEKVKSPEEFHLFQYDGNSGFNYATGYEFYNEDSDYKYETYFYNVYDTKIQEAVDSIGIYTYQPNLYVNIYVSVFNANENPTIEDIMNKTAISTKNDKGKVTRPGYHKFQVSAEGYPRGYQNSKLYVLIKLSSNSSQIKIPLDSKTSSDATYKIKQTSYDSGSSNNVYSYVKTSNGVKSLLDVKGVPARIKLYTKPTQNAITYVYNEKEIYNPNTFDHFDESVILQPILPAEKDGHKFYGWFTNNTFTSEKLDTFPLEIFDNLVLFPAFCQKILFDYDGDKDDIVLNIDKYNSENGVDAIDLPVNKVTATGNKEFAGWEYTNKAGTKVQITEFYAPYKFDDAKLNGDDIICTPIWKTVTSNLPVSVVEENLVDNKVVFLTPDKYSPDETGLFSVNGDELKNKIQTNSNTALIWLESKEVDDNKLKDYKDYFSKKNDKEAVAVFDINLFKQEKDESLGTKVQKLTSPVYMELDVSNNTELLKAAESNNLLVSQIHNGEATSPVQVQYIKETKKIKFPVDKFSIFAFELKESTQVANPSGEKSNTDSKQDTKATTDSNFKTPVTGIY